ncbi:hypothetical protein [Streptomyces bluensis]|uniref:Uncharacterized protein n=1 Tax=Streptomyces bluensis TaxID=33897 RepID=A0ABW6UFR1_9ACTN
MFSTPQWPLAYRPSISGAASSRLHLDHYDQLTGAIGQLDARIEEAMAPFEASSAWPPSAR